MMLPSLCLLLCGPIFTSLVSAIDLYVSPSGSDSNAGGAGAPLHTLTKAQQVVQNAIALSMTENITVHIADGTYILSKPLVFTSKDSGTNGYTINWKADGSNVLISGGLKVTNWTAGSNGIYSASVPTGTLSRNLYVGGKAANYARRKIMRNDFSYGNTGMSWNSSAYDWLMSTQGIANAEVRFINSFTDRYAPIQSVGNRQLVMKQNFWANQIWGWDTVNSPFADFGVWIQNALGLLSEGGEFYLDSAGGKVYYMPLNGEDLTTIDTWLGVSETLIAIGGTYDSPAHDISFSGLNFAHTTWLRPGQGYGYVDQQTGGYIGENVTYPAFEASRPHWYQMPGAIQISAANSIAFSGGSYTQLGAGGFGIGNDPNAHITGVGLGASNVAVTDGYFTQVMGNSVCAGGVQANAHHPSDARMINSHITISGNIFYNSSSLFSSTVPIFVTYIQYSTISHNDLYISPYSGICHGYGWGSNDAGGSQTYIDRGLYNYQPLYQTPTTSQNNLIEGNLVHSFGLSHTDLGAYYTLSKSPSTLLRNNYAYDSSWYGSYLDEGSNSLALIGNVLLTNGNWYNPNQGAANSGMHTGNNTLIDNYGHTGTQLGNAPGGSGDFGNTFIDNYLVSGLSQTSEGAQRAAYRAGVLPGRRGNRPVSNPQIPDAYLSIGSENGYLAVNISNFDDVAFTGVTFSVSANSGGYTLVPVQVPNSVPPDSFALATYIVDGTPGQPSFSATVRYTNPRTGASNNLSASGQPSISFNQPPPTSTSTSTSSGTGTSSTTTAPTTITSPPSTTTTTLSVSGGSVQTHWGQCGGNGWSGPTSCQPPYACSSQNPWYSQCL